MDAGVCRLHAIGAGCALLACVASSSAVEQADYGGSPIAIGAGARALGMGGAFASVADDASANTWNPGGMIQLERAELSISAGWYANRNDRSDGSHDRDHAVDLDHASAIVPFFALGCQQTIGVAWQREFDFTRRLSIAQQQTVSTPFLTSVTGDVAALRQAGSFASSSLSYAIEPLPGFGLGVTGKLWGERWTGQSVYRQDMDEQSSNDFSMGGVPFATLDSVIQGHQVVTVEQGASAVAGAWLQATSDLSVALVYKPRYTLALRTDLSLAEQDTSDQFGTISVTNQASSSRSISRFTYPTSVTGGLSWRHADEQTVALDVSWIHWQEYRIVEGGVVRSPVSPTISPADFHDTVAIRLGFEQLAIFERWVAVGRCGLLYEGLPGASKVDDPSQAAAARATIDHYVGASAGASVCLRHVLYDLGAQVRYGHHVGAGQFAGPDQLVNLTTVVVRAALAWQF